MAFEHMTSAEPQGRLQRRKARTRAAIVLAATELFHENGYEATSIQQVAELADTGVGTLYGYFPSKRDILREVLKASSDEALGRYFAIVDQSTTSIDRICTAMAIFAEYIRENHRVLAATFQASARERRGDEHSSDMLVGAFAALINAGIERGEICPLPAQTTAQLLISTVSLAVLGIGIWAGREDDPELVPELQEIARKMLRGMT
jgi:AcrR family transcriptional regulator